MDSASSGAKNGRRRRSEVTVATIAQLAGVTPPTVSKVLNGRSGIAVETRDRIEALLREHGYRRTEAATASPSIEVAFYGLESYLAMGILRGVEQAVRDHGYAVGFTDLQAPVPAGRRAADRLLARRPTGIIAVNSVFRARQYEQLTASGIPMVVLDPTGEPVHSIPSVGAANWSGGISATRHLLDLGHRRIGVITGPLDYLCARARLDACRGVLDAAGLPLDPALVRHGRFHFEDGLKLGRQLLELPDPPTAILCGDDLQALGVYEAARLLGVPIPDRLSVVGFDDIEVTRWCGPPMTTVRQPFFDMGATAARMVLQLALGEAVEPARVEVATQLVVRASTAAPRGSR